MLTSIRYIVLCALRDKLFAGLIVGVVISAIIASTLGGTALLEEREMALSYAGGVTRAILAVGLIVFVCFHIRSAFDSREIDVMLSRPLSRPRLVIAYWLGFALVSLLIIIPTALTVALLHPMDTGGFVAWTVSELLETWMLVAMALFAGLALKSAVSSVMTCLGVYVLSRMMAFFIMTADAFKLDGLFLLFGKYSLKLLSILVPRLDFFSQTNWLVYGVENTADWMRFAIQAAIFIPLLLLASIIDFQKKQF